MTSDSRAGAGAGRGAALRDLPIAQMAGAGSLRSGRWRPVNGHSALIDVGGPSIPTVLFYNGRGWARRLRKGRGGRARPARAISRARRGGGRAQRPAILPPQAHAGGLGRGRTLRGGLGQDVLFESESRRPVVLSFMAERTPFPRRGWRAGSPAGEATRSSTARRSITAANGCSRRATACRYRPGAVAGTAGRARRRPAPPRPRPGLCRARPQASDLGYS